MNLSLSSWFYRLGEKTKQCSGTSTVQLEKIFIVDSRIFPLHIHQLSCHIGMNYSGLMWFFLFCLLYFNLLHRVQQLSSGGSGNLLVHQFFCCWHCNMSYCIDNTIKGMELLFQFCVMPVFSLLIKNLHFIDSNKITICFIIPVHLP